MEYDNTIRLCYVQFVVQQKHEQYWKNGDELLKDLRLGQGLCTSERIIK